MKSSSILNMVVGLVLLLSGTSSLADKAREDHIDGLPAYGKDQPLVLPVVAESRLDNGLTLWLIERPGLPLVSMYLATRAGSTQDPEDLKGLSNILSATLDAGTTSRSSLQIAEQLQAQGADLVAGVGMDISFIGIDGLSQGADQLLGLLADIAMHASFPEAEVSLAIENTLQGIVSSKSGPTYDLNQVFRTGLLGDHPYAFVNPDPGIISKVTRADLVKAYRHLFRPGEAILVMAGNLPVKDMQRLANKHLGSWRGEGRPLADIPMAPQTAEPALLVVDRPGSVQSTLYVGRPMPAANNPDEYALKVANTLFGGAFSSRLLANIREDKGYTYSPSSVITSWNKGGQFSVSASVRNEVTAATLMEIFYELDRLATTLPADEELESTKRLLKGSFLLSNEVTSAIAATLISYWIDGKTPADLAKFIPAIEKVSKQDIQAMGRKYLASRKQVVAISGDASAIKDDLSLFGEVTLVKP